MKQLMRAASVLLVLVILIGLLPASSLTAGAANTESNPQICSNFDQFKAAMENPSIQYVKLTKGAEYNIYAQSGSGRYSAVTVLGKKTLILDGVSTFTAYVNTGSSQTKWLDALMTVPSAATLEVKGNGELVFRACQTSGPNAAIYNYGTTTIQSGAKITGTYNNAVYGRAIYQASGWLTINGGTLTAVNALNTTFDRCAVYIESGTTTINGGTFSCTNTNGATNPCYGIIIYNSSASVKINRASIQRLLIPSGKTLGNYMDDSHIALAANKNIIARSDSTVINNTTVDVFNKLTNVILYLESPVSGHAPDTVAEVGSTGYGREGVTWYNESAGRAMTSGEKFLAGTRYGVRVKLRSFTDYAFAINSSKDPMVTATMNGYNAQVNKVDGSEASKDIYVYYSFGVCPEEIQDVGVESLDEPEIGYRPDYSAQVVGMGYRVYPTDGITWYEDGNIMSSTSTFRAGHKYSVSVWLSVSTGYAFATNGTDPATTGQINGNNAKITKAEGKSPDKVINLSYDFGTLTAPTTTTTTKKPTTTSTTKVTTTSKPTTTTTRPVTPGSVNVERIAGGSRTGTAVAISKKAFTKANTVILADGNGYADSLAGVPLAYALEAPILLVRNSSLDDDTKTELQRLGTKKVIILGGELAISNDVKLALEQMGITVERIAGKSRYDTAVAIADKLEEVTGKKPTEVFFAYSQNYADALSVGGIAAVKKAPILYVAQDGVLSEGAKRYIQSSGAKTAYVLGGELAISNDAIGNIKAAGASTVDRVSGNSRYATCIAINERFKSVLTGNTICVATGTNFPDALAGGVLAAKNNGPLVLVPASLTNIQTDYIGAFKPANIYIFGGEMAVSKDIENQLKNK